MGFKVDSSFLRFLTMGALASQQVGKLMAAAGLRPIELERYSSSNKIWGTKVKRLRLPDLLCVETGLRVEVRAKTDLAIRMSDAPNNPERRWFSGLTAGDMVGLVQCSDVEGTLQPAENAELFWVADLRGCPEEQTRLGPPKSASEGSERDREWPSIVPKKSGRVLAVNGTQIRTQLDSGRAQTYQLRNMTAYVREGDRFPAATQFIAGLPRKKAAFSEVVGRKWDPRQLLQGNPLDRYVAAKALGFRGTSADYPHLERLMEDDDARVALEAAGSLTRLGDEAGLAALVGAIEKPKEKYLRIEAVFLLSEQSGSPLRDKAAEALQGAARRADLAGDEARQAAIWGLGQAGLQAYDRLLDFLDVEDENERIHAVVAFAPELPNHIVRKLVGVLADDNSNALRVAAASSVLAQLRTLDVAVDELINLARTNSKRGAAWAKAVLGSYPPNHIAARLQDSELAPEILPVQLVSSSANWTKQASVQDAINFVRKQTVFPPP